MRHKYQTRAIVLARTPAGEANLYLALLTEDLGLVYARAQGVRKRGAKLASSLATFSESEVMLVRGADGWRIAGATLMENWFTRIPRAARPRAARLAGLLLRLVHGEEQNDALFILLVEFFEALHQAESEHDAAEVLAALRLLSTLGLDAGEVPRGAEALGAVRDSRASFIARINRGIEASGL